MILDRMPGREGMIDPRDISGYNKNRQSGVTPTLIEKTVTENKTYNASEDNADGYSKVTVNVAGGGGETFEVEIVVDLLETAFTTNKSYDEVKAAIQANKTIKFIYTIQYQGETETTGTTSAVDYNSEGDFMCFVISIHYENEMGEIANISYLFEWGNPETYTQVSKAYDTVSNIIF